VVDWVPKVTVNNYDSRPALQAIADGPATGTVLLEWDIAVSQEMWWAFEEHIREDPDVVHVAPYRLYEATTGAFLPSWMPFNWVERRREYDDHGVFLSALADAMRISDVGKYWERAGATWRVRQPIAEGDPFCNFAGFGMTYIPREVAKRYLSARPGIVNDLVFFDWHYQNVSEKVPVHWDVQPVHLHWAW